MKVLLIGSGAREHAVAEQIAKSAELYVFMSSSNPGIIKLAKETQTGNIKNPDEILKFALKIKPDYAFSGPEEPLAHGAADILIKNGIDFCGPVKDAARLESDKGFCRELLQKHVKKGIPKFAVCKTAEEVDSALKEFGTELVVKPAGLTGGKGVKVQGEHLKDLEDGRKYAYEIIKENVGGTGTAVIEEKLIGEEFSLQAFTDGKKVIPVPLVQDHKRAFENDSGPNTGGMGSYSDANWLLPFVQKKDLEDAIKIMEQSVSALEKEYEIIFKGILYGGFMLTKKGPMLLEYNVRFGDPEAMNVLPILKTDFNSICTSIIDGNLINAEFQKLASVCKYLVPDGYPENPRPGTEVFVDEKLIAQKGAKLYYASVNAQNGKILTTKSRTFGITAFGETIANAEKICQAAIESAKTNGLFYRRDIGTEKLLQKRISHMAEINS